MHIASRTVSKADAIIASLRDKGHKMDFTSHSVDAMDSAAVADLIRKAKEHELRVLQPFGLKRAEALKVTLRRIDRKSVV